MPKYEILLATKTFYSYVVEAPTLKAAKELALTEAEPDSEHAQDPSDGQQELSFESGRRLPADDDAAVDIGSDEPRV